MSIAIPSLFGEFASFLTSMLARRKSCGGSEMSTSDFCVSSLRANRCLVSLSRILGAICEFLVDSSLRPFPSPIWQLFDHSKLLKSKGLCGFSRTLSIVDSSPRESPFSCPFSRKPFLLRDHFFFLYKYRSCHMALSSSSRRIFKRISST